MTKASDSLRGFSLWCYLLYNDFGPSCLTRSPTCRLWCRIKRPFSCFHTTLSLKSLLRLLFFGVYVVWKSKKPNFMQHYCYKFTFMSYDCPKNYFSYDIEGPKPALTDLKTCTCRMKIIFPRFHTTSDTLFASISLFYTFSVFLTCIRRRQQTVVVTPATAAAITRKDIPTAVCSDWLPMDASLIIFAVRP